MTDRLNYIISIIPDCNVFVDVGCDHGYVSYEMLKRGKCRKVVFTDISEKCLLKAQKLLEPFIIKGLARGVVCDGFNGLNSFDLALIAGMGGMEIIKILSSSNFLPRKLVLSPQKNVSEVRKKVVELGYHIDVDRVFYAEGKFYDILLLSKGEDKLNEEEILFGRSNILERSSEFIDFINHNIRKLKCFLANEKIKPSERAKLEKKVEIFSKYVK